MYEKESKPKVRNLLEDLRREDLDYIEFFVEENTRAEK